MGIRSELQTELARAFDTDLADAVREVEGSRSMQGVYDPELGGSTTTTIRYFGRGVFGQYKSREVDGTRILASDVRLKVLQNELLMEVAEGANATPAIPAISDQISGYRVINVGQDPAQATWTIQLRK